MRIFQRTALATALAVLLYFLLATQTQVTSQYNRGLLWELTRSGVPASYLFGTLHSEDPEVLRLATPVQQAFDASRTVMLEILPDTEAVESARASMLMAAGSLRTVAGDTLFAAATSAMRQRGIPEILTAGMHPWAVAITLSMPEPVTGEVLDLVLYRRALEAGKRVHALETIAEQIDVFSNMPLPDQLILLTEAVEQFPGIDALHAALTDAWKQRDLARLVEISETEFASGDTRIADGFHRRLVVTRNRLMAERMQPYLQEGGVFVAVGALHLPGESGLLRRLEQGGYTLRMIY